MLEEERDSMADSIYETDAEREWLSAQNFENRPEEAYTG